jgi:hypothetical protein
MPAVRPSVWSHVTEAWTKAQPALMARKQAAILDQVKRFEGNAKEGAALPEADMAKLDAMVMGSGSPEIQARYQAAKVGLNETMQRRTLPPEVLSEQARQARASLTGPDGVLRGTPEQVAGLKYMEDLAKKTASAIEDDPLNHAAKIGIIPEPVPLDPRMEPKAFSDNLGRRRAEAEFVSQYYNREPVYFLKSEVQQLTEAMRRGGPETERMLGQMADAFGADAPRAFRQFASESKDAAVIASLGYVISKGGSPDLIHDASAALKMKLEEGAKFKAVGPSSDNARSSALAVIGKSFSGMPGAEQNAIDLALLAYEGRARRKTIDPKAHTGGYDANEFKEIVKEVIGESKGKDGTVYGGIDYSNRAGTFWGGNPVLLPSSVRQGYLARVVNAIQPSDLYPAMSAPSPRVDLSKQEAPAIAGATLQTTPDQAVNQTGAGMPGSIPVPDALKPEITAAGVESTQGAAQMARAIKREGGKFAEIPPPVPGAPYTQSGKPLSIQQLRSAELIAIGPGRYVLNTAAAGSPPEYVVDPGARDGRYVLDITKLEPKLRQRLPNAFKPDGSTPAEQDPIDREIMSRLSIQGVR